MIVLHQRSKITIFKEIKYKPKILYLAKLFLKYKSQLKA